MNKNKLSNNLYKSFHLEIERINQKILDLNREKQTIGEKLSVLRKEKEFNNQQFINKKANVTSIANHTSIGICFKVICAKDMTLRFKFKNKHNNELDVQYYEWIN